VGSNPTATARHHRHRQPLAASAQVTALARATKIAFGGTLVTRWSPLFISPRDGIERRGWQRLIQLVDLPGLGDAILNNDVQGEEGVDRLGLFLKLYLAGVDGVVPDHP
jgi:hypothetical protein